MAESYSLPGISETPLQTPREIFAHFTGAEILEGVTLDLLAETEILPGTALGRVTASGKYVAWDSGAVDGSETAVCIMRAHGTPNADNETLAECVFGQAVLKADMIEPQADIAAIATDLGAVVDTVRNTFTF
jgi:hypothetical protein